MTQWEGLSLPVYELSGGATKFMHAGMLQDIVEADQETTHGQESDKDGVRFELGHDEQGVPTVRATRKHTTAVRQLHF